MAIEINPSTLSSPIPTVNGISVIWLGDWDNARIYRRNEGVFYDGSSYRANKTTSEEPNPTALDWDLIAQGTNVDTSTIINNHIANTSNPHSTTAAQVGAIPTTEKGIASGVATLDSGGKIPDTQIPDAITRDSELTNYYNKTETDSLLNTKANVSTTYSKSETNTLLAAKANQSTTYTKTETDGLLNAKANQSTTYTKIETDSLLNTKANQATTYSKTETDTLLNAKANQTTTYTKTETDGLLASKANQSTTYTKTEVDTLVNARPDNLIELGDVVITSPIDGQSLVYDDSTGKWINETVSGGGGGSGEANTATNVGTAGVGIYKQKTGVNLEFKKVNAGSNKISITDDTTNSEVDIDVNEANLTLGNLAGTLSIAKGGTGSTTASAALTALGAASSSDLTSHTGNTSNPHSVTAAQVGNTTAQWNANRIQGVNVHTTTPTNGQVLVYSTANSRYEPTTPASGGGKVIQVARATRNTPWTLSFTGNWQSTGLAVTITPLSATSTLHIIGSLANVVKSVTNNTCYYNLEINDGTTGFGSILNIGRRSDAYPEPVPISVFISAVNTATRTYTLTLNLFGSGTSVTSNVGLNYLTVMEIAP